VSPDVFFDPQGEAAFPQEPAHELRVLHQTVALIERAVDALPEIDDQNVAEAKDWLLKVVAARKKADDDRKWIVKPINDQVKRINERFKAEAAPLVEMEAALRAEIGKYELLVRERAEAQEREARRALLARQEQQEKERVKMAEVIGVEVDQMPPLLDVSQVKVEVEKTQRVESGDVTSIPVWVFSVVDPALVPREFCSPDDQRLRAEKTRLVSLGEQHGASPEKIKDVLEGAMPGVEFKREMQIRARGR